jgi:hypothetical protein
MTVTTTIRVAVATLVAAGVVAPAALSAGEPKNEWPFTRPVGDRSSAQVQRQSAPATSLEVRGEAKDEWPFTRPVAERTPAEASQASATPDRSGYGEAKNEPPFTRPAASPPIVIRSSGGFDWADAGIGAGATLGLVIAAFGAFTLLATHSRRPRPTEA